MSLQNGNAAAERSLSDNKNLITAERTNLSDEAIRGLRMMKEQARSVGGAHKVNTSKKDLLLKLKTAHRAYIIRKKEEEAEAQALRDKKLQEQKKEEAERNALSKIEKKNTRYEEKERLLNKETDESNAQLLIAQVCLAKFLIITMLRF